LSASSKDEAAMTPFTTFGDGLRRWRQQRSWSQLDLSLEADISARHVSNLETGRAQPSREMVLHLSETLGLPLRARNELLEQAGFTRAFGETKLDGASLAVIREALQHMLTGHMPLPALVCDRYWNLVDTNATAQALLAPLQDGSGNLARMMMTPTAQALILNWPELVADFMNRLRLEVARSGGDPRLQGLLDAIRRVAPSREVAEPTDRPFIPVRLRHPEGDLALISLLAEFGAPRDITISDLRIELFLPADDATRVFFEAAARQG
jgi:transcriptional regulator with XRE-family HTH domain